MVHYCCAFGCVNSSATADFSFHNFPKDKKLQKIWITKIKRDERKDFNLTKSTKICSQHFTEEDFIRASSKKKRLRSDACPSIFTWSTKAKPVERSLPEKRAKLLLEQEIMKAEQTATASEGEGEFETNENDTFTRGVQVDLEVPCKHRFSVEILKELCDSPTKEAKYFLHFTGFKSYERFLMVLEFVLPNLDRSLIINWASKAAKKVIVDTSSRSLFDSDRESAESSRSESDDEGDCNMESSFSVENRESCLSVADEFLLVLMKLRLGSSNIDLSVRFNIAESSVCRTFITWINYLYVRFGSLKIWPHRDVILSNMPEKFQEEFPNTVIIIDATELRIQTPSSLVRQSQSYSSYKSTNTLKCLIGVDPKGGILFVSQLYTGSISDKEIVKRSGFLDILKDKVAVGELQEEDAVMADKGFDISEDLKKIKLCLNIPPFLEHQNAFTEDDVIKTQTIAKHRIHVERAIGKVRRFQIFSRDINVTMLGIVNQIWTVCCMLSNFNDPIL